MGLKFSKKSKIKDKVDNDFTIRRHLTNEDNYIEMLRNQLENNVEMFLLNNLLLCVQFFENYERDVIELQKNLVSETESKLNTSLIGYQKSCLMPDLIADLVNKKVRFNRKHGPKKDIYETLVPQRIFIHHENVEIEREFDNADYTKVEGPVYRCVLRDVMEVVNESTKKEKPTGYIKVEKIGEIAKVTELKNNSDTENNIETKNTLKISIPSTSKTDNLRPLSPKTPLTPSKYYQKFSKASPSPLDNKENKFIFDTPTENRRGSLIKLFRSNESTSSHENIDTYYEYSTVTALATKRPLQEVRAGNKVIDCATLPDNCFEKEIIEVDTDVENDFKEEKLFIHADNFFKHFGDVFEQICPILGFSDVQKKESQGRIIYIDKEIELPNLKIKSVVNYEIYPAISTNLLTVPTEWSERYRVEYDINKDKKEHFPTFKMMQTLNSYGVSVLPIGRLAKRGYNPEYAKEWTLSFPRAERYIQTYLNHVQTRSYLFILLLFKSFIEIENPQLGLNTYHIRTVIYQCVEENWKEWHDYNLGTKITEILYRIEKCLSYGDLSDYFVEQKNLFESTPSKYLRISQERIKRILERPFMYMLSAVRNIKYIGSKFPVLDVKSLFEIVSTANAMAILNPGFKNNFSEKKEAKRNSFEENSKSLWARQRRDNKQIMREKKRQKFEKEKKEKQQKVVERKESVDSIKLEVPIKKEHYDEARKILVLKFFATHFIAMVENFIETKNLHQAKFFLFHSEALTSLWNIFSPKQVDPQLLNKIVKLKVELQIQEKKYLPPPLPQRSSSMITTRDENENLNNNLQQIDVEVHSDSLNNTKVINKNKITFKDELIHEPTKPNLKQEKHDLENEILKVTDIKSEINEIPTQISQKEPVTINLDEAKVVVEISSSEHNQTKNGGLSDNEHNLTKIGGNLKKIDNPIVNGDLSNIEPLKLKHVEIVKEEKVENNVEVSSRLLLSTIKSSTTENKVTLKSSTTENKVTIKSSTTENKVTLKSSLKGVHFEEKSEEETPKGVTFEDSDSDECTEL